MILKKTSVNVKVCHFQVQRTDLQKPSVQSRNQVKTLQELLPRFFCIMHEVTFVIESDISLGWRPVVEEGASSHSEADRSKSCSSRGAALWLQKDGWYIEQTWNFVWDIFDDLSIKHLDAADTFAGVRGSSMNW